MKEIIGMSKEDKQLSIQDIKVRLKKKTTKREIFRII